MTKKLFASILLLVFAINGIAQTTTTADKVIAKQSLRIGPNTITGFQPDTDFTSDNMVPTSKAVKDYVSDHIPLPKDDGTVLITDFGAIGNDSYDCTAAFNAAYATGKIPVVPEGIFCVNGYVIMPTNAGLIGYGKKSKVKTKSNGYNIWMGQNSFVDNVCFVGTGKNDFSRPNQTALFAYGTNKINITRCFFEDIAGVGIYLYNTSISIYRSGVNVTGCFAENCQTAYFCSDGSGEYNRFTSCTAIYCNMAASCGAGNNSFVACNFTDNNIGLDIFTGSNAGHCTVSGSRMNHNAFNVIVTGEQSGICFTGCDFQVGKLQFVNTNSIMFTGCTFYTEEIIITNSTNIIFNHSIKRYNSVFTVTGTSSYFENDLLKLYAVPATTITGGVNAGTSPTVSVVGNDQKGVITIVIGSSPGVSTDILATVNFGSAYSVAPSSVIFTPANESASNPSFFSGWVQGITTGKFDIMSGAHTVTPGTTYIFNYKVVQ